jgi:hypothetical protein
MIKQKKSIASLLKEHKTVFIIIGVVLFLIELEIFAVAAMNSGRKAWLQIIDGNGNVIHETDGKSLSDFNKYYFEKTFGPLDQYEKRLEVREQPFPFRAWFTAAVGIPIGVILLFAFVVKAYVSLFYGEEAARSKASGSRTGPHETEFEKIVATISSFNIFTIGFLLLLGVFMYWVLPNMVTYIGRVSVDTLIRFKWVFIAAGMVVVGLFIWIIYLRYLLARRSIDNQAELEKARLQLEYQRDPGAQARLGYDPDPAPAPQLEAWTSSAGEEASPLQPHPPEAEPNSDAPKAGGGPSGGGKSTEMSSA